MTRAKLLRIFGGVCLLLAALSSLAQSAASGSAVRVKDLGKLQGWRENSLVGYGIVTGLAGTGDSPSNRATRQALSNMLSQFNLTVSPDQVQSRNVAVVMVTAALPTFARQGDGLDITVTSAGDARSLVGGSLLLTPLKAANGKVYALAQGPLSVGGYRYDSNGNVIQKNHPTVGAVPGGAVVEVGLQTPVLEPDRNLTFVLSEPDFTTANRVAVAINSAMGGSPVARARDASGIEIEVPEFEREQLVPYVARIEGVWVDPDRRAKVVINERTGTVVAGGDVRISKVAISHGDLKISIVSETGVSQPTVIGRGSASVQTAVVTNSRVDVDERAGPGFVAAGGTTVADLVQSLSRLKTQTRDIISILRAVKAAGALHAELVVQ
ncbi:MAG TPA: flagellar basal body P-ring protein FlgI [Ramlibacter sp.]|nr:flagellar basal body P-ring protein FlgI [Ramlibacter sp.]